MYVNESIPVKQQNSRKDDSETLFLEINLRFRKWLIVGAYKPPDQSKSVFLESLSKSLSIYLDTYENVILLWDFNIIPEDKNFQLFADSFNLENMIKKLFDENNFNNDLKTKLDSMKILDYSSFEDIFINNVLNTRASVKTKFLRANNHNLWQMLFAKQ